MSKADLERSKNTTVDSKIFKSKKSSKLQERVIAGVGEDTKRQEIETEEVYDVLSISSDSQSIVSISSASSDDSSKHRTNNIGSINNNIDMSGRKRKLPSSSRQNDKDSSRGSNYNGAILTSNKTAKTSRQPRRSKKHDVPATYLEMVKEVVGPTLSETRTSPKSYETASASHSPADDDDSQSSPSDQRKRSRNSSLIQLNKGKEKIIDIDNSDQSEYTVLRPSLEQSDVDLHAEDVVSSEDEIEQNDLSDEDEESDWENVDIGHQTNNDTGLYQFENTNNKEVEPKAVEFVLNETAKKVSRSKSARRTVTREDRDLRWNIHCVHLLALIFHGSLRSKWCNDSVVKELVSKYVPENIEDELHPDHSLAAPLRTRKFLDGLRHLMDFWSRRYHVIYRGMQKRQWEEIANMEKEKDREPPLDLVGFRKALSRAEGSRDLGAQGFCALLRALRVKTRLVFSLQPLSFTFAKRSQKQSRASRAVTISDDGGDENPEPEVTSSTIPKRAPIRLRKPRFNPTKFSYTMTDYDTPKLEEAPFPVYWVEAWDKAGMQWVAVDPMVLKLVEIPKLKSKFEPPASETQNVMSYVIAYDQDGYAKDVTRRYTQYYNAKTRKLRITNDTIGQIVFDRFMFNFRSPFLSEYDQMEDAALLHKEVSEELPNNIQDYKGHPVFVLERHLRQNEIIQPKISCGTISINRKTGEVVPIYRRQDVKTLRSATQWYKIGRQIKIGEQPLKRIRKRMTKTKSLLDDTDDDDENEEEVTLYADYQTDLYVPPPVIQGKVPKNDYGNIDIFVPSMVPKGATHITFKGIASAAKLLGIDYADAVGGFDFQARRATPRLNGIVVADEYVEAVLHVYRAQQEQFRLEEDKKRQERALRRWRRYLIALRIQERVAQNPAFRNLHEEDLSAENESEINRGGFIREDNRKLEDILSPVPSSSYIDEGGFIPEETVGRDFTLDDELGGGFLREGDNMHGITVDDKLGDEFVHEVSTTHDPLADDEIGGGFLSEDDMAGGFVPEDIIKSPDRQESALEITGKYDRFSELEDKRTMLSEPGAEANVKLEVSERQTQEKTKVLEPESEAEYKEYPMPRFQSSTDIRKTTFSNTEDDHRLLENESDVDDDEVILYVSDGDEDDDVLYENVVDDRQYN
ncbi:hypothetical protein V1511DRAFT_495023 [Dipodascopsis uninucleata]